MKLLLIILLSFELYAQEVIIVHKGRGTPVRYERGMWNDTFLTGVWVTPTPPEELVTDSTDVFVYEFSCVMNNAGLLLEDNYEILDSNDAIVPVYSLTKLNSLDGLSTPGTTLVAAVIPSADSGMVYRSRVINVKRNNGAPIDSEYKYYYHNQ